MKVIILTEAGKNIGLGHLARCIALYQAFESKGADLKILVNSDESIKNLLAKNKYVFIDWLNEEERLFDELRGATAIIIDSYLADFNLYKRISKAADTCVYIDDNKRLDYPEGIVLNANIYAEELDYPRNERLAYLLGNRYSLLRKEFWGIPEKKIGERIESVLVTFGGDDGRNMTAGVLKILKQEFPGLRKNVIIGKCFRNIKKVLSLKDKKTDFIYDPSAERMKQAMLSADIAISSGGQTLYELACTGLPTIAVAVSDNQLRNVAGFEKSGFLKLAGWWKDGSTEQNIVKFIRGFEGVRERMVSSGIGRSLISGRGVFLSMEAITAKINNLELKIS